ncbi:MAG: hypothetical protein JNL82_30460 [Myxococcales bacterium]|jgi:hypothetical protein|nr:hypothetical protein [Myxococcales bacterium]
MRDRNPTLARTATVLSRNPLGLLALCLIVGEAIAGLFLVAAGELGRLERGLLCLFVVLYPILVVAAIYRLISRHHTRLYAPADFRDERCFLELLRMTADEPPSEPFRAIVGDDFALIAPPPAANRGPRPAPGFYVDGEDAFYVTRRGQMFVLRRAGAADLPQELQALPGGCRLVPRHECDRELRALADAVETA